VFYIFPKAIKPDLCEEIVKEGKKHILEKAKVFTPDKKSSKDDPKIRKCSVCFIEGKENKINKLAWNFLRRANKEQFHYDLDYFQAVQFSEYREGGFFDWHQDDVGMGHVSEVRKLSFGVNLTDTSTFEGGDLEFYNGGRPLDDMVEITGEQVANDIKSQGTVVIFDSRDWHRVIPVTRGIRHSMVCWTVGPNFK
jgi:PKHD-type hydroxylase